MHRYLLFEFYISSLCYILQAFAVWTLLLFVSSVVLHLADICFMASTVVYISSVVLCVTYICYVAFTVVYISSKVLHFTDICPLGYFFNWSSRSCEMCALGFYQDETGQFKCKPCDQGQLTRNEGSTSFSDCSGE